MKKLEEYVRSIPDFPEPGIIFRDITTILQDPDGLHLAIQSMQDKLKDTEFDVVVGTESRGFIFGVPIAYNLHKAFVPVRKKGKLPCETVSQTPELLQKPYYINCDLSKYIAYIIDTLNHDASISSLLNPLDRINKFLKEHNS